MGPKDTNRSSIEDLLREKEKIEQSIADQFQEFVTIMFTDIAGYTHFVETHGDISAKSLLQTHNGIIFPIITAHSGRIVKTIGDAIMAAFTDPKDAVRAAVEIQKSLKAHNQAVDRIKQINIRIGLHSGPALRDGDDYFGDAVNIAARIEPTALAGQIMASKTVYEAVRDDDTVFSSYHCVKEVKGKTEPLELYRIFLDRSEQLAHQPMEESASGKQVVSSSAKPVTQWNLMWKVSLPLVLILVLLFVYPGYFNHFTDNTGEKLQQYINGFMYLRKGDFDNARKTFQSLGKEDPRAQEGLAALAYQNRLYREAEELSEKTLELKSASLYPRVIKGNIFFDKGQYPDARQMYEEAINLDSPLKWQKGEAFFRLGRISSFQDDTQSALKYYNQAVQYDEKNSEILAAKGVLLDKMGELDESLALFQQAQKLAPQDAYINAFTKSIQQKLAAKKDKERQERIDKLVDDLISTMKANKPAAVSDPWTSKPVTLFFAKMERKGTIPLREGQDEFFKLEITERLRDITGVDVVDRELLDRLLAELKMSSSSLADSSAALELGRIISARLIGDLTFVGMSNQTRLFLKFIETETSAVKISVSHAFETDTGMDQAITAIIGDVRDKIRSAFPLRGKITQRDGSMVSINIGSNLGVKEGMMMKIFTGDGDRKLVGALTVVSAEPDRATGEIKKETDPINSDYLLEAVAL